MKKFKRYIPFAKTDEEKRMVYGLASTPALDSQGEVVSISAIKKALPDYLKFPTIREMHQPNAVGVTKTTEIQKDKGLFIGAKIVDDNAWKKVKEGVLRGFSIGGRIKQKIDNVIKDIELVEISVVDRPANSEAVITVFKADQETMEEETMEISNSYFLVEVAERLAYARSMRAREGKSTTELDKAIKALKKLATKILSEADRKKFEKMFSNMQFKADQIAVLKGRKLSLLNEDSPSVQLLRKFGEEVRLMNKKDKKSKKVSKKPKKTDDVKEEKKDVKPKVEVDEAKQVSDEPSNLAKDEKVEDKKVEKESTSEKLDKIKETLDKEPEKKEEVEVTKFDELNEDLNKVASVLEKLVEKVDSANKRIEALEAQPAPTKTKSYILGKDSDPVSPVKEDKDDGKGRIAEIDKRLAELTKIRQRDLAKFQADHQDEAYDLMDEKARLLSN